MKYVLESIAPHWGGRCFWGAWCCLVWAGFAAVPPSRGNETAASIASLSASNWQIGVDGIWKVGYWTEVTVELTAQADVVGTLAIAAPDGESALVEFEDPRLIEIAAGETRQIRRLIKIGRLNERLDAVFHYQDGNPVTIGSVPLEDYGGISSQQPVLLVVGSETAFDDLGLQRQMQPLQLKTISPAALPTHWESLSGFDVIWVVATLGVPQSETTSAQRSALALWNRMGGHLVFAGDEASALLGADGKWRGMAPGLVEPAQERRFGGGIEQLAGANARLPRFQGAAVKLDDPNHQVLATVGSGSNATTVIARTPHGLGIATYVGVSVSKAPFDKWEATNDLIRRILELPGGARQQQQDSVGSVRYVGYDDLSGQVRSALDYFGAGGGGVGMISFSLVVLILVIYTALLGPGDYYLLRRLRAFEWTWLTFPLLVVALIAGIVVLRAKLKSPTTLLNQLDVVDIDIQEGAVRATQWAQAYSPVTTTWSLTASPQAAIADLEPASASNLLLSWQGLPGSALGGMESPSTAGLLLEAYKSQLDSQSLQNVPMRTGSSRSLSATWWAERTFSGVSSLTGRNGILEGRLSSPLSIDLQDCALFYNNSVYLFDGARLAAGETVLVEDLPLRRDISWRLNRRKLARASDTRYTNTPWDPESRELGRIVEMLMFYDAAGGERYTRMQHQYQGQLDATAQLKMGRAVLIGSVDAPATELLINENKTPGQKLAYYRIVYPVTSRKRGGQ